MDPLSDILGAMRLSSGVFLDAQFSAPWCITSQVGPEDCRPFMAVPSHLIAYHLVVAGELVLEFAGQRPVTASRGQLLVLPRNEVHLLGSAAGLEPADANALIEPADDNGIARIRHGGGGKATRILCGFLGSDDPTDPLLMSLPPVMLLDLRERPAGSWIEHSIRYIMENLSPDGSSATSNLSRIAELLFAEAVREYVRTVPEQAGGWIAGLRDPVVGRTLALIHARPDHPWTLDSLSREAGASRTVLNERLVHALGMSPMQYLRRRRLARAAAALIETRRTIAEIAADAGYASEAAFSRGFKKEFGCPPLAYRQANRR